MQESKSKVVTLQLDSWLGPLAPLTPPIPPISPPMKKVRRAARPAGPRPGAVGAGPMNRTAFANLVTERLNATHPDTDPNRCAWCDKPETPDATLLPIGWGARHAWLHSDCWEQWREVRRAERLRELAATGNGKRHDQARPQVPDFERGRGAHRRRFADPGFSSELQPEPYFGDIAVRPSARRQMDSRSLGGRVARQLLALPQADHRWSRVCRRPRQ